MNRIRRRRNRIETKTGVDFVNAILDDAGMPQITSEQRRGYLAEIRNDSEVAAAFERHLPILRAITPSKPDRSWDGRWERAGRGIEAGADVFYLLPRLVRPDVIVETGVASGSATAMLLAALHRNEKGILYSIDLPPVAGERAMDWSLPEGVDVGFLIPQVYRDRWKLIVGDSTLELPGLLADVSPQIFVHDSDHTFEHMIFEYALAAKSLRPGALLISDDIRANDAFGSFCRGMGWTQRVPTDQQNLGVVVVPPRRTDIG